MIHPGVLCGQPRDTTDEEESYPAGQRNDEGWSKPRQTSPSHHHKQQEKVALAAAIITNTTIIIISITVTVFIYT